MDALTDADVLRIFEGSGALLSGHFVLTSGYHSARYFEKFNVLSQPGHVETLCRELAARLEHTRPDLVVGPTTLGVLLAYEVAKHLGTPAAYAERDASGTRVLKRGARAETGQRVLVVDDILTTGGSVRECIDLVDAAGATLCGVGLLVDRAGGEVTFPAPTVALLTLNVEKFAPDAVPDWLAAVPISRPGSTGKAP
uniref:Orotate phosphoribosyltransferase n=1 Tax=uncultured Armatimonadetes bacterium TaxID=157466 RepID=A0A6J4JB16_9BACT|nr:Orotate phosphoribosyltransferase [uncultured Armatimonadetes bacterium]